MSLLPRIKLYYYIWFHLSVSSIFKPPTPAPGANLKVQGAITASRNPDNCYFLSYLRIIRCGSICSYLLHPHLNNELENSSWHHQAPPVPRIVLTPSHHDARTAPALSPEILRAPTPVEASKVLFKQNEKWDFLFYSQASFLLKICLHTLSFSHADRFIYNNLLVLTNPATDNSGSSNIYRDEPITCSF